MVNKLLHLLLISLLLCLGCATEKEEKLILHNIELNNDMGIVTIHLPENFDTVFTWISRSDYECGDKAKYRKADRTYSLITEAEGFYFTVPDSLKQVTFKHKNNLTCDVYDRLIIDEDFLESLGKIELMNNDKTIIIDKKIMEIKHKDYAVLTYQYNLDNLNKFSVEAFTFVDRQLVSIRYDCWADNCNDFLNMANKSLMTLKIQRREMFSIKYK